jgi:hypothetical protein
VPNRPPEDYLAEAELCRERAAECDNELLKAEWHKLAQEYERHAVIAEAFAIKAKPVA